MADRAVTTPRWLTLDQASKRLGIHSTTLRRWTDVGVIECFVTPGGHRRYSPEALDRFAREHQKSQLPVKQETAWTDHAIAHAREHLREQRWLVAYDESERESQRNLGRRLMGLVLQFVAQQAENPDLLSEARLIGVQHAQNALQRGRTLQDLLLVLSFFRTSLLEVVLLESARPGRARAESDFHLLHRIERLVCEVQSGIVELYLGERK